MGVPLWCKSNYSFLEGASHPEELVEAAAALGLPGLALTDRDGVYGVVRAHRRARELGLPLLLGAEVTLEDATRLVVLAADRGGWGHLCRLLTAGRREAPKGQSRVSYAQVAAHAEGLMAIWGGPGSRLLAEAPPVHEAALLREAFGDRLFALVTRHLLPRDARDEARTRERAARWGLPIVAGTEVRYHDPARAPLQDVLTCLRHGLPLQAAGSRLAANAEHGLLAPAALAARFADDPAALARTHEVAARCRFSLDQLRYRYPAEHLPDGTSTFEHLRALAEA
ncbi:MAG: PHP domain-containing protein, partial [Candidatus Sericytochromatia bacterium]|nr:PHP domain-containing protein [Candidatus Sericytochromatia bacterium]